MKSIVQTNKWCYYCGIANNLEEHHIFFGTANRKLSEKFGLKVWLCPEHHRGNTGVHGNNKALDKKIKQLGQQIFEETHTKEEFIKLFGRNYIVEE